MSQEHIYNKAWIDNSIRDGTIRCYSEDEIIIDRRSVGHGGYGVVYKATVKGTGQQIAMKTSFPDQYGTEQDFYKRFVKELRNHQKVGEHPNVIQFLGLYRDESDHYHMILEFADGGSLREYLAKHANLNWRKKYKLALEITNGLRHLHGLNIIHKDLSATNILIQGGVAKITDFGLSSILRQIMSSSNGTGNLAYIDPGSIQNLKYRRGKESDVFSLGVILWEISTGKIPCGGLTRSVDITVYRVQGSRDSHSKETPERYVKLYTDCWDESPEKRPHVEEVGKRLELLPELVALKDGGVDTLNNLNELLNTEPSNAFALKRRGEVYYNLGQYESALNDFNKSLEIQPNDAESLKRRGEVYYKLCQPDKALNDFTKSLDIQPDDAESLAIRGDFFYNLGQYKNALTDLSKSIEIRPVNALALERRGDIYRVLDSYDDALKDLNKSLDIEPDNARALSVRGDVYRVLRSYDNALYDLNRSLTIEPNDIWALRRRGNVYHALGQYELALSDLNRSLEFEPNNASALSLRGAVYFNLQRYDDALKDLNKSLDIKANDSWAFRVRGDIFTKLGLHDRARNDINRSMEIEADVVNT